MFNKSMQLRNIYPDIQSISSYIYDNKMLNLQLNRYECVTVYDYLATELAKIYGLSR